MELNEKKIKEAVVKEAVSALVEQYSGSEDLHNEIRHGVTEIIKSAIDTQVKEAIANGINILTFPKTNTFGEKKAPERTLREYIDELIQNFLKEQVDSDGKVKELSYGRSSETRVRWLVRQELGKHLDDSIKNAMVAIKQQMGEAISSIVKSQIDQAAAKLMSK